MFIIIFKLEQECKVSYVYSHPSWADAQSKQNKQVTQVSGTRCDCAAGVLDSEGCFSS